jgi:hypothetical protein
MFLFLASENSSIILNKKVAEDDSFLGYTAM